MGLRPEGATSWFKPNGSLTSYVFGVTILDKTVTKLNEQRLGSGMGKKIDLNYFFVETHHI